LNSLSLGITIVLLDLLAWRVMPAQQRLALTAVRLVLFIVFSWLLFSHGMSPVDGPAWPSQPITQFVSRILEIIWWLLGARLGIMLLDAVFMQKSWHRERLFQELLGAVVFLAATVAAVAYVLHWPIGGLIATSGALAIVVGLAVQSTLSDVFSGLVINTTQPYQPGDWISVDGAEGTVIEMNWRATHLQNAKGNTVVVPNNVAAKAKITNVSRPARLNGVTITLEVTPQARPSVVIEALERAVSGCQIALREPAPSVVVKKAGTNSITYEITCFVDDLSRTREATNALFDLAHRHLSAAHIDMRPLAVPPPATEGSPDPRARLLSKVEMFEVLGNEELRQLAGRLSRHEYEALQTVVSADQISNYLLIVASGVLSVTVDRGNGEGDGSVSQQHLAREKVEIARLGPEEAFGESGVLAGLPMTVDITALSRVVLYRLDKEELSPLLKARPELGHSMCRLLSTRQDYSRTFTEHQVPEVKAEGGLLQWLREGMQRLHELTS
jgi:small-conductance mechanosensitive channel/CRP-like cAMP-binding protein